MELCLNALWFVVSLLLLFWWVHGLRAREQRPEWKAAVAVALLVLLLFPVISMTDDLLLASAPAESEHMLRRAEAPLQHDLALPLVMWLAVALALVGVLRCCVWIGRPVLRLMWLRRLLVRVTGVRPPPMSSLLPA